LRRAADEEAIWRLLVKRDFNAAAALYQPPDRQEDVNAAEHRWAFHRKAAFYIWHCSILLCLKGQCHEIFDFRFSTWISFPKHLTIPKGPFRIFSKFTETFAVQGAPLVSLTPVANGKNLQSEKFSLFLLDTFG
jgi:hypothetical protein